MSELQNEYDQIVALKSLDPAGFEKSLLNLIRSGTFQSQPETERTTEDRERDASDVHAEL